MTVPPSSTRRRTVVIDGRIAFRPQCRGIGRAVIGLVERFPSTAADGSVKMLVPRHDSTPFDLSGAAERAELVETDLPVVALHRVAALRRLLLDLDAGVLFSPYHPFTPLAAPCPVVSAVHDCIWEADPAFAGGRPRQAAFIALTRLSLRRATAVTVPSLSTADAVRRHYPRTPVRAVVPNGVTARAADGDGATSIGEARAALGLPGRYILHVGARRPHKHQRMLVELLARLDPSVSLVLVGTRDPRMGDDIDATVDALGLRRRVLAIDTVPERHLGGLYAGAEAFVFPSLVEGYGIPPLEAMAAGTPVVASAIPVLAEVCGDGAVLVSPYDLDAWVRAVERVLSDGPTAAGLVERGAAVARAATWDRGSALLFDVLTGVSEGA